MKYSMLSKKTVIFIRMVLTVIVIWLLLRYTLRWFLPFIIAFALARILEPAVLLLCRRLKLPRSVVSALSTALVFTTLIALVVITAVRVAAELSSLAGRLTDISGGFPGAVSMLFIRLRGLIESAPTELQAPIRSALDGLPLKAAELAATLSKGIIRHFSVILTAAPKTLLFVFTCVLGTFFISATYPQTTDFISRQIPARIHAPLRDIRADLRQTSGKWLRTQLVLSAVTFCQLFLLFFILRVDFTAMLALLVTLADLLPAVGTGVILLPWAVFCAAAGDTKRTATLFAGFVVILLVKSILEPKLLSGGLGLPPVVTLMSMYIGLSAFGVPGLVILPVALVAAKRLYDRGYIRLWK